jgi:hypothetical protein
MTATRAAHLTPSRISRFIVIFEIKAAAIRVDSSPWFFQFLFLLFHVRHDEINNLF